MKHIGIIKHGEFIPVDSWRYKKELCVNEGKKVLLEIHKIKNVRSNSQNSYYWGVVIDILADYTGYTAEEMHNALKWKFLRKVNEKQIETVKSTTGLTTEEFGFYLEAIKNWASKELSVYIPDSNEFDSK